MHQYGETVQVVVNLVGCIYPDSPKARILVLPSGLIVIHVIEPCLRLIRSQASGGSCKARHAKYLITFAWHTTTS